MDFNVKKFVGDAGTAISRLVQVSAGRKHGPSPILSLTILMHNPFSYCFQAHRREVGHFRAY